MKHISNTSKEDVLHVLYYALQKKPWCLKRPAVQQEAHKDRQTLNTGAINGTGASFSSQLGHNLIVRARVREFKRARVCTFKRTKDRYPASRM